MGVLHVKFHDDRCKKKVVMRRKPFSVKLCIVALTFDLLTSRDSSYALGNPNADDRRTDGHGDSSIPPITSLWGGITIEDE